MHIRRPVAALFLALALAGSGSLAACAAGEGVTGTPKDDSQNTSGSDPTSVSQGSLPLEEGNHATAGSEDGANN